MMVSKMNGYEMVELRDRIEQLPEEQKQSVYQRISDTYPDNPVDSGNCWIDDDDDYEE